MVRRGPAPPRGRSAREPFPPVSPNPSRNPLSRLVSPYSTILTRHLFSFFHDRLAMSGPNSPMGTIGDCELAVARTSISLDKHRTTLLKLNPQETARYIHALRHDYDWMNPESCRTWHHDELHRCTIGQWIEGSALSYYLSGLATYCNCNKLWRDTLPLSNYHTTKILSAVELRCTGTLNHPIKYGFDKPLDYDFIMFPFNHLNKHWVLLVVDVKRR